MTVNIAVICANAEVLTQGTLNIYKMVVLERMWFAF